MSGFLVALEFLTTLRLRRVPRTAPETLARSLPWFSAVGLIIGLLLAGLDLAARRVLPEPALSALLVTAFVLLTGGLHLDGLADTCDGIFGGATRERRLEIMRDSRTGTFGALAIALVLLLKWSALMSISAEARTGALITIPALSRMSLAAAIFAYPYARPQGLGRHFHDLARWPAVALNVLAPAVALVALFGPVGALAIPPAFAFTLLAGRYITGKIGGLTGDSYGALIEANEVVLLLLVAVIARQGWPG
jgi:adenosylcobinamide-GDP ribazoletransferase